MYVFPGTFANVSRSDQCCNSIVGSITCALMSMSLPLSSHFLPQAQRVGNEKSAETSRLLCLYFISTGPVGD